MYNYLYYKVIENRVNKRKLIIKNISQFLKAGQETQRGRRRFKSHHGSHMMIDTSICNLSA